MPTSASSASSYATVADLKNYVHPATLGDWCSNDGSRVTVAALDSDPVIITALKAASGQLESAVLRGKRYKASDFASLTGNNREQVTRLVCNLAKFILWSRLSRKGSDESVPPGCQEALDELAKLTNGEHVFAFLETLNAAGMEQVANDGTTQPPTPGPLFQQQAAGFFGDRLTTGNRRMPGSY